MTQTMFYPFTGSCMWKYLPLLNLLEKTTVLFNMMNQLKVEKNPALNLQTISVYDQVVKHNATQNQVANTSD